MGSLENGISSKTDTLLPRSSSLLSCRSSNERNQTAFSQRSSARSRFARLFFPRKIDYVTLICTVAVFLFFFVIFQICLLDSLVERSGIFLKLNDDVGSVDLAFLKEFNGLEVVEDIKFDPSKVLTKFQKGDTQLTRSPTLRGVTRFSNRKPKLAMVFADLSADHYQVQMITIAAALRGLGYEIEVFSFKDGPVYSAWRETGILVTIISTNDTRRMAIDWLNYDGILVNSLEALDIFPCLMQEPFKYIPVIWTIHEDTLAKRLRQYIPTGQNDLVNTWKKVLNRASVVVFHNDILPILYSVHDAGNYYVIPGSPAETWEAENFMAMDRSNMRERMGYGPNEFIIGIVGNQVLYKGMWLEHALVLQALIPVFKEFPDDGASSSHIKVIVLAGVSNSNYSIAVEAIALNLSYPVGTVKCISGGESEDNILSVVDVVVYASFLGEQSFPGILLKAMSFEKPIVAPDLPSIRKYVDNRVNGYLFAKGNIGDLTRIMMQMVSNGKLSLLARNAAAIGKHTAKNLMVSEAVEGYALLLQTVLSFPSEVADVFPITKMPINLKAEWRWHLFEAARDSNLQNRTDRISMYLDKVEKQWSTIPREGSRGVNESSEQFVYGIWNEEKNIEMANMKKRREEEELKDRTDQPRGIWEEVYKNARRADRAKNELHERDDGELERTGQPLCIYEPYFGEGTWPFLHSSSLYRGLGLFIENVQSCHSNVVFITKADYTIETNGNIPYYPPQPSVAPSTKGRRPGADDIDGPSRLSLLNNPYYRDVLGEFGAIFAIGNRIDRMHKNAWIGFQSWRATARKGSLSKTAEKSLLEDIQGRKHGDTLYFWSRMDMDPRNSLKQDFWTFCDAINAGNCQFVFSTALSKMYGTEHNFSSIPPMPRDGDTWSVMHSWALPTKSFLEFVMFSRMFVDALDSQYYNEHHGSGHCPLSLTKDKLCYSRLLELLVNVWAYHSARRMVYMNPETGVMQEKHRLKIRKGQMWLKWFQLDTLKSMDEDLAEEADTDQPKKRWIWPSTGEVFWQGIYDKERNLRNLEKEKRRQQSKDKISRIKKRSRQKTLGKYVKPLPEETENSNSTATTAKLFR